MVALGINAEEGETALGRLHTSHLPSALVHVEIAQLIAQIAKPRPCALSPKAKVMLNAACARLDFHEHELAGVPRDQVDLTLRAAPVALHDGETGALEERGGKHLAASPEVVLRSCPCSHGSRMASEEHAMRRSAGFVGKRLRHSSVEETAYSSGGLIRA